MSRLRSSSVPEGRSARAHQWRVCGEGWRTGPALIALAGLGVILLTGCGGSARHAKPAAAKHVVVATTTATKHVTVSSSGPLSTAGPDWPTLLHSGSHFGAATVAGPSTGHVRWQRRLEGPITPGPVTVGNTAYVASNGGVLHAIDIQTGKDRWSFRGGPNGGSASGSSDLSTSPTVLRDGLILWPGPSNRLFALTSSGRRLWTVSAPGDPLTPAVDQARHLLVVADTSGGLSGYRLSAGDRGPVRLWSHSLASTSFGSPALAANGTTYETAGDSLFAVAANGSVLWRVTTPGKVEVSAAVGDDGTVVFGSDNLQEYGVAPDGFILWHHAIGNLTYSSPLALTGNRVVYGNHSGEMTTLDTRDGHVISVDHAAGQLWTAAAVDDHGDAYFASQTGGIYGFGPSGRRLFALQTNTKFDSYPAIAADGTLLVGGGDGVLRAIG